MSTAHSPGPWKFSDCGIWQASHDGYGSASYEGIKDATGTVVAIVVAHDPGLFTEPDTKPNARLIAAAPELLEALQGLMPTLNMVMYLSSGTWDLDDDESVRAARAAIAKATGGAA